MPSVTIVAKRKPEVCAIAERLRASLSTQGVAVAADESAAGDLVVVVGGDGTFLHAAAIHGDRGAPLLGVNAGDLGFLTEFAVAEAEDAAIRALSGGLPIEERMRLRAAFADGEAHAALNDVVVSQRGIARLMEVEAWLDGQLVAEYRSDGLIVATPTGSTAYNLAAGGPMLTPSLRAMVLTPVCPHTLTNRPLVISAARRLRVRVTGRADHASFTIDGQRVRDVPPGEWVELRAHEKPLRCVRNPARSYFDVLRTKLNWGVREG